eukprot:6361136-Pyramimonas_sp.AAC.1
MTRCCADFNARPALLKAWAASTGGVVVATTTPTRTQSIPGSVIDHFVLSPDMAICTSEPDACMTANLTPHMLVCVQMQGPEAALRARAARQPRAVPVLAKPGCGRCPRDWAGFIQE